MHHAGTDPTRRSCTACFGAALDNIFYGTLEAHCKPFRLGIVAPTDTGKTTLVLNMLTRFAHLFDIVLVCAPTDANQNDVYARLGCIHILEEELFAPEKLSAFKKMKTGLRIWLVLDDIDLALYKSRVFNQYVTQFRHSNMSILALMHDSISIRPNWRANFSYMLCFKQASGLPLAKLSKDLKFHFSACSVSEQFPPGWEQRELVPDSYNVLFVPQYTTRGMQLFLSCDVMGRLHAKLPGTLYSSKVARIVAQYAKKEEVFNEDTLYT
jgi:hypothetical protein